MFIPDEWKSKRQIIIETYVEVRSIPETAVRTGHKRDSSFVRQVIREWNKIRREAMIGCS